MSHQPESRLAHLLPHWVEHNDAHLETYRLWEGRAREAGLHPVAEALGEAIRAVESANESLKRAAAWVAEQTSAGAPSSFRPD